VETYIQSTPELTELELLTRVALAIALGGLVGLERERRERAAGLRTHILVCLGSCIFTLVSAYGFHDWFAEFEIPNGVMGPPRDPSRIAAQIVSGIGFLGGGVILRNGLTVRGLTTAATIWATGAIGMAVGAGMYVLGAMSAILIVVVLVTMRRVNYFLYDRYHPDQLRVKVRVTSHSTVDRVLKVVREHCEEVSSMAIEPADLDVDDELMTLDIELKTGRDRLEFSHSLARTKGVVEVHLREREQGA
jgi:putative Mg2+ transporter-C (MgtC) family protein